MVLVRVEREDVKFCSSFACKPWVSIRPEEVVGSAYEEPSVWKVSRQRPMLGRFTGFVSFNLVVWRRKGVVWSGRGRRGKRYRAPLSPTLSPTSVLRLPSTSSRMLGGRNAVLAYQLVLVGRRLERKGRWRCLVSR